MSTPVPHERILRVGLLGCGTVGAPVARALLEDVDGLRRACGAQLELARVAVRDRDKARPVRLPHEIVTTDALSVAIDPEIDILIEVMGSLSPAHEAICGALADNKSVISANKELLAGPGAPLLDDGDADLHYEAAVCGAIPIVRTLREYCACDEVISISGVFSGTCNYILSTMTKSGCSLPTALNEARALGFAEVDATADIDAHDAAAKLAILARIALGVRVTSADVHREGISRLDPWTIRQAGSEGLVWKLVAEARRQGDGIRLSVKPRLLDPTDALAQVDGAQNLVIVDTKRAGRLTFTGQGSGGDPTAGAILGDLVAVARRRVRASKPPLPCHA